MLNSTVSLWLGVAFVLIGATKVWLILQAPARVTDAQASTRLIAAHRIGGYIFIALFCVMGYFINVSLTAIDLPAADIYINMAASTMEKRCSKCHNLDRIVGARKDAKGWLATVNRMKALPNSGISEEDARLIVSYLASQMGQKGSLAAASLEVARAVVDQRCGRCHSLDRVYKTAETPEEWRATVYR